MEKKNYLTAEQNQQLAEKLSPTLTLIKYHQAVEDLILTAGAFATNEEQLKQIDKLEEELNGMFIEFLIKEQASTLDIIFCALNNSDRPRDLKNDLKDLGIEANIDG
ncbi:MULTISPECIES: hypothetical protein [Aerococcus]|uniref:hypothetical protein n=1 Tax=Aerococcus TaxID=1375 RepID=UPI0018A74C6E|nr:MULTISPECIES: hypothetical protein [Aerococcus]MCY3035685.1 hypothetical protein [Aerococcus sp. Group 2]MCY3039819.1 hypothetical protein [Aerococcus sp. Group 2]MCY3040353.1 hypothetical protein [Aerococcus sp. Group 2]MCY3043277.1 hypothetical protein [Aerococcus sp. Group 2]MDK6519798.1 hypothetical protein [Aerococcus urinae]